jgi:hypothetical protein
VFSDWYGICADDFAWPANRAMQVGKFRSSSQWEMRDRNDPHQYPRLVLQMSSPACKRLEVAGPAKSPNSDVSIQAIWTLDTTTPHATTNPGSLHMQGITAQGANRRAVAYMLGSLLPYLPSSHLIGYVVRCPAKQDGHYVRWPFSWLACASRTNIHFYPDAFQRAILRVTDQACHRTFSFNVRNLQDEVVYHVNIPF